MLNSDFLNFSTTLLLKEKSNYIFSSLIFIFIVFILSSVLFISNSIKFDLQVALEQQPQIIVQNQKAGKHTQITDEYLDELLQITGVSDVVGKLDGYYYFAQNESYFHISGLDDFDDESIQVGQGIKNILNKHYYKDEFNFLLNDGESLKLKINKVLPQDTNIISNDLIISNSENVRTILGLEDEEYSYLVVSIPNDSEIDYIAQKIRELYPNTKVTTKDQLKANYDHLFYYKGGIFMILYVVVLVAFFILLYKQVSSISGGVKKEIAILRSLGFSINHIIAMKLFQNSFVSIFSYIVGVMIAYIFVFYLNAPLLKDIFLGNAINNNITFTPILDFDILFLIFLFTVIPFLASVILPSWKVAISDMNEAMK